MDDLEIEIDPLSAESLNFYESHYVGSEVIILTPDRKVTAGDQENRVCRFCRLREPETTFKKKAHAIPEALGNKSFVSYFECDACNTNFGEGIETQFGAWSKPLRTFSKVRGKSGVPTLKGGDPDGGWRIESTHEGFAVNHMSGDEVMTHDDEARTGTISIKRDAYIPVAVHKTFIKIALTIMPEVEMANFTEAVDWIRDPDHSNRFFSGYPVRQFIQPVPLPPGAIMLQLMRRRDDVTNVPYMFMYLAISHYIFQVFVPSRKQDSQRGKVALPPPPILPGKDPERDFGPAWVPLDLSGHEKVIGEVFELSFSYGSREKVEV